MDEARLAGGTIRGAPHPAQGGGLSDARLAERGGRRRPGSLAAAQSLGYQRRREPRRMADHCRRTRVAQHAALHAGCGGEEPLGVHLPEPIVDRADGTDPEHEALLADSVGLALLVVLETLGPAERLAFVLHDMFAVPFRRDRRAIVGRSPEATRQLASRARRRVQGRNAVPDADLDTQREVVDAFLAAFARRRLRCARRRARPGRRAASGPRSCARGRIAGGPRSLVGRRPGPHLLAARPVRPAGARQTASPERSRPATGSRSRSAASRSGAGRSSAIDILADPERLRRLDLTILDD